SHSQTPVDRRVNAGFEVEPIAVWLSSQPERATDLGGADERRDTIDELRMTFQALVYSLGAPWCGHIFRERRPFRAILADEIVPFRITCRWGTDFLARFHERRVVRSIGVAVILRIAFAIRPALVVHLIEPNRFEDGVLLFGRPRGIAKVPETLIVVPVSRLDRVGLRIELSPHLPEIVAKQASDRAAHCGIAPAVRVRDEQFAALLHPAIVIFVARVDECTGKPGHEQRSGKRAGWLRDMKRQP